MKENQLNGVDLLCIDIQGATLSALKSMGAYISKLKYVICEVEYRSIYKGERLFEDIRDFMESNGFVCHYQDESCLWNDVLFIRQDLNRN